MRPLLTLRIEALRLHITRPLISRRIVLRIISASCSKVWIIASNRLMISELPAIKVLLGHGLGERQLRFGVGFDWVSARRSQAVLIP